MADARKEKMYGAQDVRGMRYSADGKAERLSAPGYQYNGWWPVGTDDNARFRIAGEWAKEAEKMIRTDPKIASLSRATRQSLLSAKWKIEPGSDSPNAKRNAEYIKEALGIGATGNMKRSFQEVVRSMASWLDIGFKVVEPIYKNEPKMRPYHDKEIVHWLDDIADIDSCSITGFVKDRNGTLLAVVQNLSGVGPFLNSYEISIPSDRVLLLSLDQAADNFVGRSLLRPCWAYWNLKTHIRDQIGVAAQRWGTPVLMLTTDRMAAMEAGIDEATIDDIFASAEEAADYYAGGETTFLKAINARGVPVLKWEVVGTGAFDPGAFNEVIVQIDRQMAASYGAAFAEIGTAGEGSRAVGEVHYNFYRVQLQENADQIVEVLSGPSREGGGLIARLLGFNFYAPDELIPVEEMPILSHTGLEVNALTDALGMLPNLMAAGAIGNLEDLKMKVDGLLGLDPMKVAQNPSSLPPPSSWTTEEPNPYGGQPGPGRPEGT